MWVDDLEGLATRLGVNSVKCLKPEDIDRDQAVLWYRTLGHHITSRAMRLNETLDRRDLEKKEHVVPWYVVVDSTYDRVRTFAAPA